jgi:hypothetical protein
MWLWRSWITGLHEIRFLNSARMRGNPVNSTAVTITLRAEAECRRNLNAYNGGM